jgi:hypothetical protein
MTRRLGIAFAAICVVALVIVARWRHGTEVASPNGVGSASAKDAPTADMLTTTSAGPIVRTASIAGRVTDGKLAIPAAAVCARASSDKLVSADTRTPFCTTTDGDGNYVLRDLPSARYRIDAAANGYRPARYVDAKRDDALSLKAGDARTKIDLVLEHGGVLVRGVVKDIAGGGVPGAHVTLASGSEWAPSATTFATSDAKGEFSAWLAPGRLFAVAQADGYGRGTKEAVAPGQLVEIIITPESVLQGLVVEAGTETPVPNVRVVAGPVRSQMDFSSAPEASALTDANGRFRIAGLEPGRYHPTASIAHRWGTTSESVLLGLAETSRDLVIEIHATPSLLGRIEYENGEPCVGSVALKAAGTTDRRWLSADLDGRVRGEGLVAGKYTVTVWCDHAAAQDKYDPVTIADKDVTVVWRVKTGNTVRGIVVDAAGEPVGSARVEGRTKGGDPRAQYGWGSTETATDGTFQMRGLQAATYAFTVHRDGAVSLKDPVEVDVSHDVEGVRITLPAGGGIEGKVVDGSGNPVSGVDVWANGDRWEWQGGQTMSRDDGSFAFPAIRPGTYHLEAKYRWTSVRAPGTKDDDVQGTLATVKVSETTKVRLVVESQNEQIHGDVVDEHGVALSDAFVEAEREPENAGAAAGSARRNMSGWSWGNVRTPVLTDLDGHFTVTKLSPGSYTVRAFRKGGGETVSEGVRTGSTVTLKIKKEGSVAGTVVDSKGAVPERFTVSVHDEKTGVNRSETFIRSAGGAWALRDLPAGDFIVAAEGAGRAQAQVPLAQGEEKSGVQLTLAPNASVRGTAVWLDTGKPIAGLMVFVRPKGAASNMFFGDEDDGDRKNVTDADGRFELSSAPAGRVSISMFSRDGMQIGGPGFAQVPATLTADTVNDVPPIKVPRLRVQGGLTGDLGFNTADNAPGIDPADAKLAVSVVRPGGPAARAQLAPGDEIISVDGYDVVGANVYLYWTLASVPEGTTVKLGLRRGAELSITAEHPHGATN